MVDYTARPSAFGYVVAVEGLSALRDLDSIPADVKLAALRAVNRTAERTRTSASQLMRQQVAFPARYLDSKEDGRLAISQRATSDMLQASITARFRATSLARFIKTGRVRQPGDKVPPKITVEVNPGQVKQVGGTSGNIRHRAFLIRLRAGTADLDTQSNLGLAVRLKPGESPLNKKVVRMKNGLWLLYGPAVSQVFQTVSSDIAPDAADFLEQEFLRLLEVGK